MRKSFCVFLLCYLAIVPELYTQVEQVGFYHKMEVGQWEDEPLVLSLKRDTVVVIVESRIKGLRFTANDEELRPYEKLNGEYWLFLRKDIQYYIQIQKHNFKAVLLGPKSFKFSARITVDALEIEPPAIISNGFRSEWFDGKVRISVPVEAVDSLRSVILFYRRFKAKDSTFVSVPLRNLDDALYGAVFDALQEEIIQLYIKAYGQGDVFSIWPDSARPYSLMFQSDTVAPIIDHVQSSDVVIGNEGQIEVRVHVFDDRGIDRVMIYYKEPLKKEYRTSQMIVAEKNLFTWLSNEVPDTLEYFIRATDLSGKSRVIPGNEEVFKFVTPAVGTVSGPREKGFISKYKWYLIGGGGVIGTVVAIICIDGPPPPNEKLPDPPGRP